MARLRTDRLELRLLGEGDAALVEAVYGDDATMATMPWRMLTSPEAARSWLRERVAEHAATGCGTYAVFDTGAELVGVCGLQPRGDGFEIGWVIREQFWGRGFATEAAAAVLATASDRAVVALIRPANVASIRVAEKIGLRLDHSTSDEFGTLLVYTS